MTDEAPRYLVQRATSKEWLDMDIALDVDGRRRELSASGSLPASCSPDLGQLVAADGLKVLEPWSSIVYVEQSGQLRWAGLVTDSGLSPEGVWEVQIDGFSTYLRDLPWTGLYSGIQVDPADVVRAIWAHVQSHSRGDLGVVVDGSTSFRIGTEPRDVEFTTGDGEDVAFQTGPYELLWWDTPDCGKEVDDLASEGPFEWIERVSWLDREARTVRLSIDIRERHGRRRTDLLFEDGVNVAEPLDPTFDGDTYANEVHVLGAGEGEGAIRATSSVDDGRLRRPIVLEQKDARTLARAQARALLEVRRRAIAGYLVEQIIVLDHANAPFGEWDLGDDVRVRGRLDFLGEYDRWGRIIAEEYLDDGTCVLELIRPEGE